MLSNNQKSQYWISKINSSSTQAPSTAESKTSSHPGEIST
jgi:hypothetical protein